jgi:tetratricopeptide (TPR) repeat protein
MEEESTERTLWIVVAGAAAILVGVVLATVLAVRFISSRNDAWLAARFEQGNAAFERADDTEAIACYSDVLAQDPDFVPALSKRAAAYMALNRVDLALADAAKVLTLEPKNARAHQIRGMAYRESDPDRALEYFNEGLKSNPNSTRLLYCRGLLFSQLGDSAAAMADFGRCIDLDPKDANAYMQRGELLKDQGEMDRAIADFDAAVAIGTLTKFQLFWLHYQKGEMLREQQKFSLARREFQQAMTFSPANASRCREELELCDRLEQSGSSASSP